MPAEFSSLPGAPSGVDGTPGWCYDEDGYCIRCGNGRWKKHMPECELRDVLDMLDHRHVKECPWVGWYIAADEGDGPEPSCTCQRP